MRVMLVNLVANASNGGNAGNENKIAGNVRNTAKVGDTGI